MNIVDQRARVRAAQQRMGEARRAVAAPASALLARGERHPVMALGIAAGAGFVMGSIDVHPMRVPGLGGLFEGALGEAAALGVSLLARSVASDA